ncbi:MAG: response regulator transcription factor [Marmoricola sp.]|nr:response regulator transcription factor [Marmoricola sp.]
MDDTPELRGLLSYALQRHGEFTVVGEADNGEDAIDVVARAQPDLVLLDIAMPVMDGLEALPHIRRMCARAVVVVLSGFGASHMASRAVAHGADGYVQKGAPLREVLAQIRDHMAQAMMRRDVGTSGTQGDLLAGPGEPADEAGG